MRKRVWRVFGIPFFAIGQPVGLAEEHLAVVRDLHRAAEPVRSGKLAQQGLDARDGLGFARCEPRRFLCRVRLLARAREVRKKRRAEAAQDGQASHRKSPLRCRPEALARRSAASWVV